MIIVKNSSNKVTKVSINKWGKDGNTGYWDINPGDTASWNRTDGRGFVMSIIRENEDQKSYFVLANSNIVIYDKDATGYGKNVQDNGRWIYPLN
ncbi:hypothetical protein GPY51_03860 [Photorhabdus laumondii subsp. laumondii]|uniref:Photorhabdus luminescens subsp. laumondii TTO1 complete genome segment 8/17 n=2 Tax=Photorhabdus laumondii subsp. laumondii TaxID=141679 RepID=Q7N4G5_PHOLL|nr:MULTISPECIES: hypothetical protein [Photorhabdus]AWK42131.1 hypothetical protein A4R40_11835 [Photorhabdus laumondii subsp. laumondii]AXG47452.1 hypothetical protein PluTT01m_12205 [Photorhabdus laumondii subsp. laumondii]KTL62777.1 hypothetical protein AA106_19415 [Photorhabdus laumondii subsp. laumondii]MCC8385819.1 hypothetical protein [Photorhabdus laumondii]MCC8388475.1 hypothetical protein [Photorhabdus laumondii]